MYCVKIFLGAMYKPAFVEAYKKSHSKLPIHVWRQVAGRHLPQFKTDEDVYRPVPIYVKLSGGINDPNGTVCLSVCPTNKDWYGDLTSALTEMTGKKNIDVVNMEGRCISDFKTKNLFFAGECDVIDKGTKQLIRLESVVEPPLRMANNKTETLKQWWHDQSEDISREIAQVLRGKNMTEIASATTKKGEVYDVIRSKLQENAPDDFLKVYGSGLIRTSVEDLSDKLLHAVRRSLVANEKQIRHFGAKTEGESLWKEKETQAIQSAYNDDFTMYRDIIDDAIYHPAVSRDVLNSVLYGTKKLEGPVQTVKEQQFSDYHPLESFYKTYYYNTYGKLPGHVVSAYNKTIGTNMQQKMFPGDAEQAFEVFHMMSGRAFDLVEGKGGGGGGRGGGGGKSGARGFGKSGKEKKKLFRKKKKGKKGKSKSDKSGVLTTVLDYVNEKRKHSRDRRRQRKQQRQQEQEQNQYSNNSINLVHISELLMDDGEETIASELPRLVPIDSEMELPRLVPIDQEIGEDDEHIDGHLRLGKFHFFTPKTVKAGKAALLKYGTYEKAFRFTTNPETKAWLKYHYEKENPGKTLYLQEGVNSELPRLVPIDQELEDEHIDEEMEDVGFQLRKEGRVFKFDISEADRVRAKTLLRKHMNDHDAAIAEAERLTDKKFSRKIIQYLKYMKQQGIAPGEKEKTTRLTFGDEINSELPRLVPIESRLVPIPRDEILNNNLWDQKDDDELPSISQLLSGKY